MFNPEDFREYTAVIPLVEKINKYLKKEKADKVSQIIGEFRSLLEKKDLAIPITYIFSILAENDASVISSDMVKDVKHFLDSDDKRLQLNTIIIVGFHLLKNSNEIHSFLPKFLEIINQDSDEVTENAYFFLQKFVEFNPNLLCRYKKNLIEHLKSEKNEANIRSLLQFIESCSEFDYDELYEFKSAIILFLSRYQEIKDKKLISGLVKKLSQLFPKFPEINFEKIGVEELKRNIDNLFVMKKFDFTKISNSDGINLKGYLQKQRKSPLFDTKLSFYIQNREKNQIYYYEIENEKLIAFFESKDKISGELIKEMFSQIIEDEIELELFMDTLIKLKIIKGYFSELHYFYPYVYLHEGIITDVREKGVVNIERYNYIPLDLLKSILNDISTSMNQELLLGNNEKVYYSQKKINQTVNIEATKTNSIDLQSYKKRLMDSDYLKLIANLPKEYLCKYYNGTQYLTNLGLINVRKEIDNSKIIGYFSIFDVSTKLKVQKAILRDILEDYLDMRTGIFDKNGDKFYYSKFLNEKVNQINQTKSEENRRKLIDTMAKELNIDKDIIFSKLNENLKSIGEEIKNRNEIEVNEYLDKTGMTYDEFLNFIRDLGIDYFKKGERIIIDPAKINDAKSEIEMKLIDRAKNEDFIAFSDLDLPQNIIEDLLLKLQEEDKISGIFYNDGDIVRFYTEKGIENLMLDNQQFFSFQDFFLEKPLSESELQLMRTILEKLMNSKRLKGTFDEEKLIFSSNEVLFAQNYNTTLSEFESLINHYIEYFNTEFEKIKKILIKRDETILPHEIKTIQESIEHVNYNYVHWRSGIEAYVRKANINLLRKQGLTLKKYNAMNISPDRQENLKLFEKDPEVVTYLDEFKEWVKLFNNIELKYGNVIFYQKRLARNPNNIEDREKLNSLLDQLKINEN